MSNFVNIKPVKTLKPLFYETFNDNFGCYLPCCDSG